MSLLQEEQGVIKLLFLNVDQGAFIQLQQNEGDFVFTQRTVQGLVGLVRIGLPSETLSSLL